MKGIRAHSLRATTASTALRAGARPEAVREGTSSGLRISYPGPGAESSDVPAFLTDGRPHGSAGPDRPDATLEF